jgi:transcriptional regulator with XRE-family HTH domain
MKQLAKTLQELRDTHQYTQEELARMLNISRVTLANIESGKRPVSKEELVQYSDIFDIPVDAIKQ